MSVAKETKEQNINLVKRLEDEFKNKKNYAIIDELCSEDFVFHFDKFGVSQDRKGLTGIATAINTAFSDVQVEFVRFMADGEFVIGQTIGRGTHDHALGPYQPSGKKVTWNETNVYRVEDGKIKEFWPEVDFYSILDQIGAIATR